MTNLFIDMSTLRIAPTAGREFLSTLVSLVAVTVVAALFIDSPLVMVLVPGAFAAYGLVRVVIAAVRTHRASSTRMARQ